MGEESHDREPVKHRERLTAQATISGTIHKAQATKAKSVRPSGNGNSRNLWPPHLADDR